MYSLKLAIVNYKKLIYTIFGDKMGQFGTQDGVLSKDDV